jgi:hypothetical protein
LKHAIRARRFGVRHEEARDKAIAHGSHRDACAIAMLEFDLMLVIMRCYFQTFRIPISGLYPEFLPRQSIDC